MTAPTPTGQIVDGPDGREVRLSRRLNAPVTAVWAAVTESDRLETWIGRWEPSSGGRVIFFMTAEGDDVDGAEYVIRSCHPPRSYAVDAAVGDERWRLRIELEEVGAATILSFSQALDGLDLSDIGPGWEYYLDRLAASLAGTDVGAVAWDDYYPALRSHYAALAD